MDDSASILSAVSSGVKVYDLGRPIFNGMPQSPRHPRYWHAHPRRHGDAIRADGVSAADDLITTGTHVGTHIDALSHIAHEGKLSNGHDAEDGRPGGGFEQLGVHTIVPMICRGILLDIPSAMGVDACEPNLEITPADLEAAVQRQGIDLEAGDVLLIRTGWGRRFDDGEAFIGKDTGTPGVGEAGAMWIAEHRVRATGADTIAYEHVEAGKGTAVLPAHRVLIVRHSIYIIEALDLEALSRDSIYEFVFIVAPLKLVGATGSPVRPLAVIDNQ